MKAGELFFLEHLAPKFSIPVPEFLADPVRQTELKQKLKAWGSGIVKPDVLSGKRGKAGGIRKVTDPATAQKLMKALAAKEINGQHPRTAYVVQTVPADYEIFSAITYNSTTLSPSITVSLKGGMDVEEIGDDEKVTMPVNVFQGLDAYQASEILTQLGVEGKLNSRMSLCLVHQWDMFISSGMQSCEINPWRATKSAKIFACDFKATFDESNFKAQSLAKSLPEYPADETPFEEEMNSWAASSHQGQAHVSDLGGKRILPILFGGGASTIITETLCQFGGEPIFLSDFGGNPPYERMKKTAAICFKHNLKKTSLLLILGGKANNTLIDVTFAAIADALEEWVEENGSISIPVVVGRGGPRLAQGLAYMKKSLENLGMPHVMFGPDTPITLVAEYAARMAKALDQKKTKKKGDKK
jgi:succinyl-CoA synthetase beta subunit